MAVVVVAGELMSLAFFKRLILGQQLPSPLALVVLACQGL
jgi:hypothetical protein